MERRLLVAAGLSLAVLLLWEWVSPKPAKRPEPQVAPTPIAALAESGAPAAPAASMAQAQTPVPAAGTAESAPEEVLTTLSNGVFQATFTNRGAVLKSFILTGHLDAERKPLDLVRDLPDLPRPLSLDFGKDTAATKAAAAALFVVERPSNAAVRFRFSDGALAITKEFRIGDGYLFEIQTSVAGPPYTLLVGPGLRNPSDKERKSSYVMATSAVVQTADGLKLVAADKSEGQTFTVPARAFAGVEDNYFLEVLVPSTPATARLVTFTAQRPEGKPSAEIAAGLEARGTLDCSAFFGPKDVSILESYGLGLERTVDFGWYGILAKPLLWMLKKSYSYVGNWGLAILIVTFLIRLALFPLTAKSYTSMKKMQKLAPKMNAIRDKYKKSKTDAAQRQKMNTELMALYQSEGYNPMSGCLPILLQLPILVAFYNVLSRSIELRHAPFYLWIKDLSAVDGSYVLVVLMIVSMYLQQAMTPSTLDPVQKKVFMFMPVLWGFFLKDMPSGLVLYWLFSNLLTILQQLVMNRIVKDDAPPPPKGAKALKQARA
jgi:YidC/Oxa1 family membrane protein insertase